MRRRKSGEEYLHAGFGQCWRGILLIEFGNRGWQMIRGMEGRGFKFLLEVQGTVAGSREGGLDEGRKAKRRGNGERVSARMGDHCQS